MFTRILLFFVVFLETATAQTPLEIIRKAEDLIKGKTCRGSFTMTVTTPEYTRSMEMDSWWVGNEKALITVTAPAREAGNKTLKVGNELWMYLRNTETTIKIPPSMMLQSWNGSDFTNDDLVRESNIADDYDHAILFDESIRGANCWKLELTPKPDAPVVWGRMYYWVRKEDYGPARVEYYDERGALMRTMMYADFRKTGGRIIPMTWSMISNNKAGHQTDFVIRKIEFDVKISDRVFSFRELEKGR